jgi:hypothetical protein
MFASKLLLLLPLSSVLFSGPLFQQVRDLPAAVVGQRYATDLKVTFSPGCSVSGVNWGLVAGDLPGGMTLTAGRLQGEPAATGSWEFALRASSACSDAIVPMRLTVFTPKSGDGQAALISVQSRSRKR